MDSRRTDRKNKQEYQWRIRNLRLSRSADYTSGVMSNLMSATLDSVVLRSLSASEWQKSLAGKRSTSMPRISHLPRKKKSKLLTQAPWVLPRSKTLSRHCQQRTYRLNCRLRQTRRRSYASCSRTTRSTGQVSSAAISTCRLTCPSRLGVKLQRCRFRLPSTTSTSI